MFLSNPTKSFLAAILLLFFIAGCGFRQNDQTESVSHVPETKNKIPFPTKEPDNFQCEIVVISGETMRKTFTARKGEKRRIDFNFGDENQSSVLQNDSEYLIAYKQKIYTKNSPTPGSKAGDIQFSDLTSEILNRTDHAEVEELGRENNMIKYKVRIDENNASEVLIYVDETIGMPVRQEFFNLNGEERMLQYAVELRNLKLEADESLFGIPKGFRKVSVEEFYKATRATN